MKPKGQRDLCSFELIYYLLVIWKRDFCRFVKPSFPVYLDSWEQILQFGCLKTRLLPCREPTVLWNLGSRDLIFCILAASKATTAE
jgi:hypothetical protein